MSLATKLIRSYRKPLGKLLGAVRRVEEYLGPEDDWVEDDRRILYEAADKFLRPLGRPTIRNIDQRGAGDYVTTAAASPDEVEVALDDAGYDRNLLSTRKYRSAHDGGRQWAVGSYVLDPADTDWQHHVYIFPSPDGGTDIYAHRETSVRDPHGHVTDEQTGGDPNDRVETALAHAEIGAEPRNLY